MIPDVPTVEQIKEASLNIVVGMPLERTIDHTAFWHAWNVARRGWAMTPLVYGRTDLNRNKMARHVLQSEYSHIVMLDCDHLHPPDIVERLARWVMEDPERLIVGGLNFRRTAPYDPCAFVFDHEGKLRPALQWEPGIVEVNAIGHGCIIISREVFEKIDPPWWAYAYNHASMDRYPSEDMMFCQQVREAGIKMYCDTTTTSPHLSPFFATEAVFRNFLAANPNLVNVVGQTQRTSVIIPTTGRAKQLTSCVQNLIETVAGHDVEIIVVVDDNDQDSQVAMLDKPVRTIVMPEHVGPVACWNEGAKISTGDYLVLGADDLFFGKNWLSNALDALNSIGGSGMVGFNDGVVDGWVQAPHFLISRDYAVERFGGVLAVPHYKHYFLDVEATNKAKMDDKYVYAHNAYVEHRHHLFKKSDEDTTYQRGNGYMVIDRKTHKKRQRKKYPVDYEAVFT